MTEVNTAQSQSEVAAEMTEFTSMDFRRCLGEFVTGVTVITTVGPDGTLYGLTANSFSSVSLDPPLILWSLRLNATNFPIYSTAETFAVNILAEDQVDISNRFAKSGPDRFAGVSISRGGGGVPLIDGAVAQLECRREASYPGGDHVVFIGRVLRVRNSGRRPLALRSGSYMTVHSHAPLLPSDADDRNIATLKAVHAARPVVEDLAKETDHAVGLGVWGSHGPTIIWWTEASKPLPTTLRCGLVLSLLDSATGGVFAAFASPDLVAPLVDAEVEQAVKSGKAPPFASRLEFDRWRSAVRDERMASKVGIMTPGINFKAITSFSVPVFDARGEIVLALTLMGDAEEFNATDDGIPRLREAAARLSERLGFPSGHRPAR